MKREELADIREEHVAVQVGPATHGNNVRCLSTEHPEGGVPWPCTQVLLVLHIDSVERAVRAAANAVLIQTGLRLLSEQVRKATEGS